jgi:hypothetical protein
MICDTKHTIHCLTHRNRKSLSRPDNKNKSISKLMSSTFKLVSPTFRLGTSTFRFGTSTFQLGTSAFQLGTSTFRLWTSAFRLVSSAFHASRIKISFFMIIICMYNKLNNNKLWQKVMIGCNATTKTCIIRQTLLSVI